MNDSKKIEKNIKPESTIVNEDNLKELNRYAKMLGINQNKYIKNNNFKLTEFNKR